MGDRSLQISMTAGYFQYLNLSQFIEEQTPAQKARRWLLVETGWKIAQTWKDCRLIQRQ